MKIFDDSVAACRFSSPIASKMSTLLNVAACASWTPTVTSAEAFFCSTARLATNSIKLLADKLLVLVLVSVLGILRWCETWFQKSSAELTCPPCTTICRVFPRTRLQSTDLPHFVGPLMTIKAPRRERALITRTSRPKWSRLTYVTDGTPPGVKTSSTLNLEAGPLDQSILSHRQRILAFVTGLAAAVNHAHQARPNKPRRGSQRPARNGSSIRAFRPGNQRRRWRTRSG